MATWKKIIVSGSNASLNSINVTTNVTAASFTGSFSGSLTGLATNATSASNALTASFVTGSNVYGPHGSNSVLSSSFAVTASFVLGGSTTPGALSEGAGIADFSFNGAVNTTIAVSGASTLNTNAITKWTGAAFANSSLTDNGTAVTGNTSIQLTGANSSLSGSFSGSFFGNGANLSGLATSLNTSGSTGNGSVNLNTQTLSIVGTANEIETSAAGQTITVGLPNNVTIGNNLIVTNDLTVFGTASFQDTQNLLVADRFILLASGSNTAGDGGLVVQQGTQNIGEVLAFDSGTTRWAFTSSFNASNSSFTPDAYIPATLNGVGNDPTTVASRYQTKGNIFIADDENIWIYS